MRVYYDIFHSILYYDIFYDIVNTIVKNILHGIFRNIFMVHFHGMYTYKYYIYYEGNVYWDITRRHFISSFFE